MVMAFNADLVARLPEHWHGLLRPDLRGKLSLYDAPYQSLYAFAQMKAGAEGRPGRGYEELQRDLDGVLKFSIAHREIVRLWWTSGGDFMNKLLSREVVGGVAHGAATLVAQAEGKPVRTVLPLEGTAAAQIFWSIPKGTQVSRLAEEFINDFFTTEFQLRWGKSTKWPAMNLAAGEQIGREDALYARFLPTSQSAWDRIRYYPYDLYFEGDRWSRINDVWEREVLRKRRP
jgi:spermidine/putrescine-binding protein